jgi:hypothetical protein
MLTHSMMSNFVNTYVSVEHDTYMLNLAARRLLRTASCVPNFAASTYSKTKFLSEFLFVVSVCTDTSKYLVQTAVKFK